MDALWTCIKVVYLVVTHYGHVMDTLRTCVLVVYLVVSLWTHYGHVL